MKWILNRIRRLTAVVPSQQSASGQEPLTPADPQQADSVPNSQPQASLSQHTETTFDAKRKELGVENSLKDIPGVTDQMLVAFGEHGVASMKTSPLVRPMISMAGANLRTEKQSGMLVSSIALGYRVRIVRQSL